VSQLPDTIQQVRARQRDLRVVTSLVILVLAGGFVVLWPSIQHAAVERFGSKFPGRLLVGELAFLVIFLVAYLWMKGRQVESLIRELLAVRGVSEGLNQRLSQARGVLEASADVHFDQGAGEALQVILKSVTEALHGDRGILYRQTQGNLELEREGVFPSSAHATDPTRMAFEDEVAQKVVASGTTLMMLRDMDPQEYGIQSPWPHKSYRCIAAAPLFINGVAEGALLIRNSGGSGATTYPEENLELLEIFAGFAAGVIRNVRAFQGIADRHAQLDRAHQTFLSHQKETVEIETITTMASMAASLCHALSGPTTSISGFADILTNAKGDAKVSADARAGLHREISNLRERLQTFVDFMTSYGARHDVTDLSELLQAVFATRADLFVEYNLVLRSSLYEEPPLTVVDQARMRQVFVAFLDFIAHSSSSPGPRALHVRSLPHSGHIRIQFAFEAPHSILQVLEPLLNPNVELGPLHRQHGLALAIASGIVRQHQGEVFVETLEHDHILLTLDIPIRRDVPPAPTRTFTVAPHLQDKSTSLERVIAEVFGPDDERPAPPPLSGGPVVSAPTPESEPLRQSPEPFPEPVAMAEPSPTSSLPRLPENAAEASQLLQAMDLATPEFPVPGPAAAPEQGAPTPGPVPPAAPGGGLDEIFNPGDLWQSPEAPAAPPVRPPPERARKRKADPLLNPTEVEDALKLFDNSPGSQGG
jgi:C4-dicarboxylate-specific signal transduction histidine kinase